MQEQSPEAKRPQLWSHLHIPLIIRFRPSAMNTVFLPFSGRMIEPGTLLQEQAGKFLHPSGLQGRLILPYQAPTNVWPCPVSAEQQSWAVPKDCIALQYPTHWREPGRAVPCQMQTLQHGCPARLQGQISRADYANARHSPRHKPPENAAGFHLEVFRVFLLI